MSLHNTASAEASKMEPVERDTIRTILLDFLEQMNLPFASLPFDAGFADAALEFGFQHYGFKKEIIDTAEFHRSWRSAIPMTINMFNHLKNTQTQYWIALYCACIIFFDDLSVTEPGPFREFHARFICAESQKHPLLDTYANLLRTSKEHFHPSATNLIISSSLDFITGLVLEYDYEKMKVHKSALNYPRFFRTLTGLANPFVIFTFPPHIPFDVYIQILPSMADYINDFNEVFSFYKEQLANDNTNHISLIVELHGWTKLEALHHFADSAIRSSRATEEILACHPEALEIYTKSFLPGYIGFHAAAMHRYKLDELKLTA